MEWNDIAYFFSVESFGGVERLNDSSRMTNEECIAGCAGQHTDHGQPDINGTVWRITTVTNTQHV